MSPHAHIRQYQQQSIATSSPERLVAKLYDLGIASCLRDDRSHVRAVLIELVASLDHERGGEVAEGLDALYAFCLSEARSGDLSVVQDILSGLREAWNEGVVRRTAVVN